MLLPKAIHACLLIVLATVLLVHNVPSHFDLPLLVMQPRRLLEAKAEAQAVQQLLAAGQNVSSARVSRHCPPTPPLMLCPEPSWPARSKAIVERGTTHT